jgi:hypothetical protein
MWKKMSTLTILATMFLGFTTVYLAQTGGTIDLGWHVMAGGGAADSSGGDTVLGGTLGQLAVGSASGGSTTLQAGFWVESFDPDPTGVTLASFDAAAVDTAILVTWETTTEVDTLGFHLHRAESEAARGVRINAEMIRSKVPPGSGTGAAYEWRDANVESGITYSYWLERVDNHGASTWYGPVTAVIRPDNQWRLYLPLMRR